MNIDLESSLNLPGLFDELQNSPPAEDWPKISTIPPDFSHSFFDPQGRIPLHPPRFGGSSRIFQTPGISFPPHLRIGGTNGISNTPVEAYIHAERLSSYTQGYSVEWVYNSTHSAPIDIAGTLVLNYQGIPTLPSFLLKENWERFHKENEQNPNAKYLQICHSQGAAHVKHALLVSSPAVRGRINVLAFGPCVIIPKRICNESYNYASKRDFICYGEFFTNLLTNPIKAVQNFEDLKELILLAPHPDALKFDHNFDSPTFQKIIKEHIENYLEET